MGGGEEGPGLKASSAFAQFRGLKGPCSLRRKNGDQRSENPVDEVLSHTAFGKDDDAARAPFLWDAPHPIIPA
jgi:hypothetical protein